ncbi:MAG TPA: methyltransferase domain-containing protein [Desulfomonilaceae bacterium]|nr:methyltransferase domain-containing protein [Desulfomonilaceae bacterium]
MVKKLKRIIKLRFPFALSIYLSIRHQQSKGKIRKILRKKNNISIEVGAGSKRGQGEWVTIDMNDICDIYWDLRRGIPFPDESVKKIYSSHFLEHLSFGEAQQFLDESRRVLVPGGQFSICVPNARLYLEAYVNGGSLDDGRFFGHRPAYNHTTQIDVVNYIAYMGGEHKYMFDEENLLYILGAKGFKHPRARKFDATLDLLERDHESIYAEAEK